MQLVEGVIGQVPPTWDHEDVADKVREQIRPALRVLGCIAGSGNLDLPGSNNWYVPDLAVAPRELVKGARALLPHQTLLVVEVASASDGDTDRIVKRRRYAEYGAPLYLLVDRQERSCTLYAEPGELGYRSVDGPHPFGTPLRLPEPSDSTWTPRSSEAAHLLAARRSQPVRQQLRQVPGPHPGELGELGAAGEAVRQDGRTGAGGADGGEEAVLGAGDGDLVVAAFEAEVPGQAATAGGQPAVEPGAGAQPHVRRRHRGRRAGGSGSGR